MIKSRFASRFVLVFTFMLLAAFSAVAQDASTFITTAHTEVKSISALVVNIVCIIMGIIGVVMLATNLAKYFKGDPSSNDALMKIGGGMLIAIIILQVIRITLLTV